jgi:4-diphosphocytidyl-2-C-methyl-D-erythritol kinase
MIARAYAKINLGLRILDKREDGFHNIETIFHRINLFDKLSFEQSATITLICSHPDVPTDNRNLCLRAAHLLLQKYNVNRGVKIHLTKNIPIGAGLGGGSSDAASTLRALTELWDLQITGNELHDIALQLGSDVPYFIQHGSAYATSRGEVLKYFNLDVPYWIVVVYPNIHISTSWAYSNLKLTDHKNLHTLKDIIRKHINEPKVLSQFLRNDFESLVLQTHESLSQIREGFVASGAEFVQMSGSGSAIYGFFVSRRLVTSITAKLQKHYPVFITAPHFKRVQ